jgi:hypothetical protein
LTFSPSRENCAPPPGQFSLLREVGTGRTLADISSWREFLLDVNSAGLFGEGLVVSDDHAGLKKVIAKILREAPAKPLLHEHH